MSTTSWIKTGNFKTRNNPMQPESIIESLVKAEGPRCKHCDSLLAPKYTKYPEKYCECKTIIINNEEHLVTRKIKNKVTYITYHKNGKGKYPLWEEIKNKYKRRK